MTETDFMNEAIQLARQGMNNNEGGPFGCVIVKDGVIIGRGNNTVLITKDPTAHAEVTAIRDACRYLNSFQLEGCELYTSCEPCPMCLGAIYWARPSKVFFACTRKDAAAIGFDDDFIYHELEKTHSSRKIPMQQIMRDAGMEIFNAWKRKPDKTKY